MDDTVLIETCRQIAALEREKRELVKQDQYAPDSGPSHARHEALEARIGKFEAAPTEAEPPFHDRSAAGHLAQRSPGADWERASERGGGAITLQRCHGLRALTFAGTGPVAGYAVLQAGVADRPLDGRRVSEVAFGSGVRALRTGRGRPGRLCAIQYPARDPARPRAGRRYRQAGHGFSRSQDGARWGAVTWWAFS